MIHYILEILLVVILFVMAWYLWMYRRQMRNINKQLQFHRTEETNLKISTQLQGKEWMLLRDELNALLEEQRVQKNKSDAKERQVMEMVTNVSHDIRTPLTSISGYFQMFCETDNEENKKRYQAIISGRLKVLSDMLEDFFTYFKVKNGQLQKELGICDIQQILYETLFMFYDEIKGKGIHPVFNIIEEQVEVIANEKNIRRVFFNIIKNAMVHGKESFLVEMKADDTCVKLTFENKTDEKMLADCNSVFERFYCGDQSRSGGSSGLGLAIVKELVEEMGGSVEAYSQDGYFGIGVILKK